MSMEVNEMFTYVKLKNFMSFKEATFDFKNGKKGPKKFVSIYGENGSGKSNFVQSIDFLMKSVSSFDMLGETGKIQEVMEQKKFPDKLIKLIIENVSILNLAEHCRMAECEDETRIEYGFSVNGHEGYYIIHFSKRFTYEKLYYFTGKQRGVLYEISVKDGRISYYFSNKLFENKKVELEMIDEITKFWGKHTFLSILTKERREKNEQYIDENYLPYVFDILDMLQELTVHYKKSSISGIEISAKKPVNVLTDLESGQVDRTEEYILDSSERIIREFFTQTYADIKDVFYEKKYEEKVVNYRLFVKKMIGGKIRTIDFVHESAGTQRILEIIRALLGAFCGVTVVYDEIDDGIHDLLLKIILESMMDDITGQLIITTHNTYLLESIDIKSVYVIHVDYQGNKEIRCLDQYPRIQSSNNPRNMYLKGLFGGVPFVDLIDYDMIIQELGSDVEGGR